MPAALPYDALVLAGGRSSRLGGVPKALLRAGGRTLLESTLAAVAGARRIAVAGPPDLAPVLARCPGSASLVREEPAFSGPAAAVGAGLSALPPDSEWTLVLACDMPHVGLAVRSLLDAAAEQTAAAKLTAAAEQTAPGAGAGGEAAAADEPPETPSDAPAGRGTAPAETGPEPQSLLAVDADGYRQPLAALYRTADLRAAVAHYGPGGLANMSLKGLLARVQYRGVVVPPMSTADVDTWADAQSLGVSAGELP